ncbi:MAG: hypothetical protein FVQ79_11230 [Planctomycetes bacterium]|nr:hypothetical protein [Planctomycetota bacterium]
MEQKVENNSSEIVYSISFIQALVNPPFIFGIRIALSFMLISLMYGTVKSVFLLSELFRGEWYIVPILFGGFLVFLYLWWTYLKGVFKRNFSNQITFNADSIGYGYNEIQNWISKKLLQVRRGFLGVSLIQDINGSTLFMVPTSAIEFSELKKNIEINE